MIAVGLLNGTYRGMRLEVGLVKISEILRKNTASIGG